MINNIPIEKIIEVVHLFKKEFRTIYYIMQKTGLTKHSVLKITDKCIQKPKIIEEKFYIYESKMNFI